MKKLTSVLLLLTVIFVSACKKDKTDDAPISTNVSFKVNGTLKQASGEANVTAFYYSTEKTLQFIGDLENNQGISLYIQEYKGVGEYDVASDDVIASYVTNKNGGLSGSQLGSTGSIKITSSTDKLVKGTFQFVVRDPITDVLVSTITEGQFEAKLTSL